MELRSSRAPYACHVDGVKITPYAPDLPALQIASLAFDLALAQPARNTDIEAALVFRLGRHF
jgi:hypothetical protein